MMIAIFPPADVRYKLWVAGGLEPEDMHITLFHFPTEEISYEMHIKIMEVVTKFTASTESFGASVSHLSRFENVRKMQNSEGEIVDATEPTDVIMGAIDSIHLSAQRARLAEMLDEIGAPYSKTFKEFKPHLSIKYVPHGTSLGKDLNLPLHFTVDNIQIWGETENDRYVFHLQ